MDKLLKDLFEAPGISGYENEVAQSESLTGKPLAKEWNWALILNHKQKINSK